MKSIAHLLEKHSRDMAELENEQKKNQRRREKKLNELDKLVEDAIRMNSEASAKEMKFNVAC